MSASTTGRTQHPGLVLASMTLANAMVLVDQTAVPLTLAETMRTYDVGSQKAQWVLNASLVSLSALLVLGGQLGDMLGRRRVFTFGTIIFAAASACAAFAPTFDLLILCRAVQGAGGALRAGRSRTEAHSRTAESSVDTEGVADSSD